MLEDEYSFYFLPCHVSKDSKYDYIIKLYFITILLFRYELD